MKPRMPAEPEQPEWKEYVWIEDEVPAGAASSSERERGREVDICVGAPTGLLRSDCFIPYGAGTQPALL